jgi:MFS superfamily sulfate permease-like transporter
MASGYPPVAGILTAIVGGIVGGLLSNAELTIKGPAAGLIVICLGAITELGGGDPLLGYRLALGVGVAAGLLQVGFALLRVGILGEIFPLAAVHGMLAAIGVIIISRQLYPMLGIMGVGGEPLELLAHLPGHLHDINPEVALIGLVSLALLVGLPRIPWKPFQRIPAPMFVIGVAIPAALMLQLQQPHSYTLWHHAWRVGPEYLVQVPASLGAAITLPDFSALQTALGWKYVLMFALVGSLESLLSARAVELMDPWQRRADLNRDLLAVGLGNTLVSCVGGLPMISEIVRSSANTAQGAQTRFANVWHGVFLLACVGLVPWFIAMIPMAALAAMLVYTGTRLASPSEFLHTWKIGPEQLAIFCTTLVVTLTTDLLLGIASGVALKFLIHALRGVPPHQAFRLRYTSTGTATDSITIQVEGPLVFSNWLTLRRAIQQHASVPRIILDVENARLIDHSVMCRLRETGDALAHDGRALEIRGLAELRPVSRHPDAARIRVRARRA